jgi:TPR repeat protein
MKTPINHRLWERSRGSFLAVVLLGALAHPFLAYPRESETNKTQTNTTLPDFSTLQEVKRESEKPTQTNATQAASATAAKAANPWDISKAISPDELRALEKRATSGDAQTEFELGIRYKQGYGVGADSNKALELFKKAADGGYAPAQLEMAYAYSHGQGVEQDLSKGTAYLKKAADQGDEMALQSLGHAYENGEGIPRDLEKAEEIFWGLYHRGDGGGQMDLSSLAFKYLQGDGTPTNIEKAVEIYIKLGDASMIGVIAGMYHDGTGVVKDLKKGVELYARAADQKDPCSLLQLAGIYDEGDGVKKDSARAAVCLQKLVQLDDEYHKKYGCDHKGDRDLATRLLAMRGLAAKYRSGEGVPKDLAKVRELYGRLANHGDTGYKYVLANMYLNGEGGEKDLAKAVEMFKQITAQTNAESLYVTEAEYSLGAAFYNGGNGVPPNYAESAKWFRLSADNGEPEAQRHLGLMYGEGRGVAQDYEQALRWFRLAADQGDAPAQCKIGVMYFHGQGVPKDFKEAIRWFRRAAEQGESDAQTQLARMYVRGDGVPANYIEAYKWLLLAGASDNKTAREGMNDMEKRLLTREQITEGQRVAAEFVAKAESPEKRKATDALDAIESPRFTGSGFFVTEDGYLLTSYHVVEDANTIKVKTKLGTFRTRLVATDKANDVAMLKAEGTFPALPIAPSRGIKLGGSVFTIGFPNINLQGFAPKLTKGEISSLTGAEDDPRAFQISVAVQPGNSGGPLVDMNGNVVGIVEARLADMPTLKSTGSLPQNVNYAMKSSVLSALLESLPEVSAKLREPSPVKDRKFEDVVKETESATALVLVY